MQAVLNFSSFLQKLSELGFDNLFRWLCSGDSNLDEAPSDGPNGDAILSRTLEFVHCFVRKIEDLIGRLRVCAIGRAHADACGDGNLASGFGRFYSASDPSRRDPDLVSGEIRKADGEFVSAPSRKESEMQMAVWCSSRPITKQVAR